MICILCQRREAERAQACDPCRLWLPTVLRDIGELHTTLDVTARANGTGPRVSGSREAPVPLALDVLDLAAAARLGSRGPHARGVLGDDDQIGHLSVATELEFWVIDWIGVRTRDEHRPEPLVTTLVRWLDVRLDWACDEHNAVDEFAADMRTLRAVLRRANGDLPQQPEMCHGVPCKQCDLKLIYRTPNEKYPFECDPEGRYGGCHALMTEDEYRTWTRMLAASTR